MGRRGIRGLMTRVGRECSNSRRRTRLYSGGIGIYMYIFMCILYIYIHIYLYICIYIGISKTRCSFCV